MSLHVCPDDFIIIIIFLLLLLLLLLLLWIAVWPISGKETAILASCLSCFDCDDVALSAPFLPFDALALVIPIN